MRNEVNASAKLGSEYPAQNYEEKKTSSGKEVRVQSGIKPWVEWNTKSGGQQCLSEIATLAFYVGDLPLNWKLITYTNGVPLHSYDMILTTELLFVLHATDDFME